MNPQDVPEDLVTAAMRAFGAATAEDARTALASALPLLEEEVREKVAGDLEAQIWPHETEWRDDQIWEKAAVIARTGNRYHP